MIHDQAGNLLHQLRMSCL